MKKVFYPLILLAILGFFSCKKENIDEKPIVETNLYVSKIKRNNVLAREFVYDDNMRVQRVNYTDGLGALSYFNICSWANNIFYKDQYYDKTGKLFSSLDYEYNDAGLLTIATYRDANGYVGEYTVYQYNSANQCVRETSTFPNYGNTDIVGYFCINEYEKGNRIKTKYYDYKNILKATLIYTYDDKIFKYKNNTKLNNFNYQHNITSISSPEMDASGNLKLKIFDINGGSVTMSFAQINSSFEYNSDNYPIKETITYPIKTNVDIEEIEYIQKVN